MDINSILDFLNSEANGRNANKDNGRYITSLIPLLSNIALNVVFLIISIIFSETTIIITSSALIVALILYFIIIQTQKWRLSNLIPFVATSLIFCILLIISPRSSTFVLFIPIAPFFTYVVLGLNRSKYYSLALGGIFTLLLLLPINGNYANLIDIYTKVIIIPSYFLIHFSLFIIVQNEERLSMKLQKSVLDKDNEKKYNEELLAKLSHQIRTPLNNIMIVSNLLSNADLDGRYSDMVDTIQASTNNLVSVLNSMINISTVDTHVESNEKMTFNLNNAISSTIKMFSTQSTDVSFNFKISNTISKSFIGDPIKLKQILLNIIESIIKNKSGQKVNIEIQVEENSVSNKLMFSFICNKPLHLPKRKDGFFTYTSDSSSDSVSTIDLLDLTISQQLVQKNGGELNVILEHDYASIKFDYLMSSNSPRTIGQSQGTSNIEANSATPNFTSTAIDLSNANVLLVEDNLINQKIVILSLKKVVKSIDVANNGKEALDKFGTSKYDIILMDIQMPIMNGYVTTKKIREIEASINTHTPIIAITANALLGDREDCIASGMDDYISKPFQIEVLIQKMKSLLGGR